MVAVELETLEALAVKRQLQRAHDDHRPPVVVGLQHDLDRLAEMPTPGTDFISDRTT